MADVNPLQRRVLQLASAFAERFPNVKAVHIFGSIARGATDEANDVDLLFEFSDDFRFTEGTAQVATHSYFQDELDDWREWATQKLGKPVKPQPTWYGQHTVAILEAIKATPAIASCGKAFIMPTPPVARSENRAAVHDGG